MPSVVRDPAHPDFEHGAPKSVKYGCGRPENPPCPARPTCREAAARKAKRYRLLAAQGQALKVDAGPAMRHVADLVARGGGLVTERRVMMCAGVSDTALHQVRTDPACSRLHAKTASKILAVTLEQVLASRDRADKHLLRATLGSLAALGYPTNWVGRQVGHKDLSKYMLEADERGQNHVRGQLYRDVLALAERMGGQEASPQNTGLPISTIARARKEASAAGYYPPAAYDDQGNLNLRYLPGHPWNLADDECTDLIEALRLSVDTYFGPTAIAMRTGLDNKRVQRVRERAGLRYTAEQMADGTVTRLRPECRPAADRVRLAVREYDAGGDPVLLCLRLGVTSENGNSSIPGNHPAVLQYRAEKLAAKEREAAATTQPVDLETMVAA